jgi:hypothetical protein
MHRVIIALGVVVFLTLPASFGARGQHVHSETEGAHTRLASAINELEGAIAYLKAAPHDFGGHREAAIREARAAIEELRAAMSYQYHGPEHQH